MTRARAWTLTHLTLAALVVACGCASVQPPRVEATVPPQAAPRPARPSVVHDADALRVLADTRSHVRSGVAMIDEGEVDGAWRWLRAVVAELDAYLETRGTAAPPAPARANTPTDDTIARARDAWAEEGIAP